MATSHDGFETEKTDIGYAIIPIALGVAFVGSFIFSQCLSPISSTYAFFKQFLETCEKAELAVASNFRAYIRPHHYRSFNEWSCNLYFVGTSASDGQKYLVQCNEYMAAVIFTRRIRASYVLMSSAISVAKEIPFLPRLS